MDTNHEFLYFSFRFFSFCYAEAEGPPFLVASLFDGNVSQ